jgi:hypothetical protein
VGTYIGAGILLDYVGLANRMTILVFAIVSVAAGWYLIYFLTADTKKLEEKYKIYEFKEESGVE